MPKAALVVTDYSADQIAGLVYQELLKDLPDLDGIGIGGEQLTKLGLNSLVPIETFNVVGDRAIWGKLPGVAWNIPKLLLTLPKQKPDVFVGVDSYVLNSILETRMKKKGVPTVHLVSPKLYLYWEGRMQTIKRSVDHMLCLFPFETSYYNKAGVSCEYVGHPFADLMPLDPINKSKAKYEINIQPGIKLITMLPGSRKSVIGPNLPLISDAVRALLKTHGDQVEIRMPLPKVHVQWVTEWMQQHCKEASKILISGDNVESILKASDLALVSNGTVTLQCMCYQTPFVSYAHIIKNRERKLNEFRKTLEKKVQYLSLPNLIAGKEIIPEFVMDDMQGSTEVITKLVQMVGEDQTQRLADLSAVHRTLKINSAKRTSAAIQRFMR